MRSFDTRGHAAPRVDRNPSASAPERAVPPAGTFARLAERLHLGPPVQRRATDHPGLDRSGIAGPDRPPRVGSLPVGLRATVEARSGFAMDDVRVHRDSPKPAAIGALAYAQGRHIHLGPGQEKHLPHEAWHVVQQKQGRVRATRQMMGVGFNRDARLEREADAQGTAALQMVSAGAVPADPLRRDEAPTGTPVQAVLDNLFYPRRTMGIEVTEATTGNNRLFHADFTPAFTALLPAAKAALWQPVNLPDENGVMHPWRVATAAAMAGYFTDRGDKQNWMRWNDVSLTEDHGEYEWIVHHPNASQNMGYYRGQLNQVNASRQLLRATLGGIGPNLIVAENDDPAVDEAFRLEMSGTTGASAQITFESTNKAITKQILYEGMSHGLNKRNLPNRETLAKAPRDVVRAARISAARIASPGIDGEVLIAYLYGDLIHKIATLADGPTWGYGLAANAKGWRNLFPKSKPFQVTMQAYGQQPTAPQLTALQNRLNNARGAIIQDVLGLFAAKLTSTARVLWQPAHFAGAPDPGGHIHTAANAPVAPLGGAAALVPALSPFLLHSGLNLATEFNHVRDALTNPGLVVPQVVRSHDQGFAQHAPNTQGFATEDRGEVATTFPNLDSVYARIKKLARRF